MIGPPVAMPWMRLAPFVGLWLTPWLFQSGFVGSSKWFHGADTARRRFSFVLVRAGSLRTSSPKELEPSVQFFRAERSVKGLIRHPQSLCEDPHDLEGEIRGLAYKKKKLLFRDGNKLNVGDRHGSRAPWLAVNQRHFTKNIVSRKIGNGSVADLNAHVTALDNEKLVSLLAFAENDTAGSYSERFDIITSQETNTYIAHHCQLLNHDRGDVSSITRRPCYPARMCFLYKQLQH